MGVRSLLHDCTQEFKRLLNNMASHSCRRYMMKNCTHHGYSEEESDVIESKRPLAFIRYEGNHHISLTNMKEKGYGTL